MFGSKTFFVTAIIAITLTGVMQLVFCVKNDAVTAPKQPTDKKEAEPATNPGGKNPNPEALPGPVPEPKGDGVAIFGFSSDEGQKIFRESLKGKYMASYPLLSDMSVTQRETTTCSIASLTMAMNALNIDQGSGWREQQKWYADDDTKDSVNYCCKERKKILPANGNDAGVTLEQLFYTAICNGMQAEFAKADSFSEIQFRDLVKAIAESRRAELILNFNRPTIGQEGGGHFSPIGGYHEARDLVLILDTSRYKYPTYWVNLPDLYKAMLDRDSTTKQARGVLAVWERGSKLLNTHKPKFPPTLKFGVAGPSDDDTCPAKPNPKIDPAKPPSKKKVKVAEKNTRPTGNFLIPFSKADGQQIFLAALETEYMTSYPTLADQAVTQTDKYSSSVASLTMVKNALNINPKSGWRERESWLKDDDKESIKYCCKDRAEILASSITTDPGMSVEQTYHTALCNDLQGRYNTADKFKEDDFRSLVKLVAKSKRAELLVFFSRQALGMQAPVDEQYSPIGGYSAEKDMVLLLDTNRQLYPTYWLKVSELYKAMQAIDKSTGLPRGFLVLWETSDSNPPTLPAGMAFAPSATEYSPERCTQMRLHQLIKKKRDQKSSS